MRGCRESKTRAPLTPVESGLHCISAGETVSEGATPPKPTFLAHTPPPHLLLPFRFLAAPLLQCPPTPSEGLSAALQISTKRIAMTLFWNRFLKGRRRGLFFSIERVCNLHQQNTCKYGVECKNVHLCR